MTSSHLICQETDFQKAEQAITVLAKTILNGETDSLRNEANDELTNYLLKIINTQKAYQYPFGQIEHVSVLQPKNKKFKLFTWFVPYVNGSFEYYGIIQTCNKRGKKCQTYQLKKNRNLEQKDVYTELNYDEWYGCLYYDIIPIKINKVQYYTLLGWDGSNITTTKKIIEILTIDKNKKPIFGANIFNSTKQRFLIEYSSKHPISLQYDKELESIVFDHLEPIDGVSQNNFSIYATNLSYDILKKTDFGWKLETNIYLNNIE
tara:strand:+ start:106 stop:891 length:786 start_codon:yes stop_codon:yes gene_type:complete